MKTNISGIKTLSRIFKLFASPARLQILLAIGERETCVCHLEAAFGWRQAYISQQLMALRKAGLLLSRKEGRFVYYRLADPGVLEIIRTAGEVLGLGEVEVAVPDEFPECGCPSCHPRQDAVPLDIVLPPKGKHR